MKTTLKLLGIALVVLVVGSGLAAASGYGHGATVNDGDRNTTVAERTLDGHNSPWVIGDERLDRFQDRFDLTDAQMDELRNDVSAMIDDGATRDDVRATIVTALEDFGVEDPTLGPVADQRLMTGPHGPHDGDRLADGGPRYGGGHGGFGGGPHGPADGSCMS